MARQVAQWVSGHDFPLTGGSTPPRVAYCHYWCRTGSELVAKKITDDLSSIPESLPVTNKDLPDLASISPSDPFMGHLGICAYDLID